MTNGEKIKEIFPSTDSRLDERTGIILVKWVDGATKCFKADWWNAEYKEPTTEHIQKIDKSAMMHEIYMAGVNMAGEYQGCWVRFKEIEKIIDRYVR